MRRALKVLALSLSLVMLISLVVGCQNKGNEAVDKEQGSVTENNESQKESKPQDKYAPKEGKTYEIRYLTVTHVPVGEDSLMARTFNEKFNVKIIPEFVDGSKWDDILNVKLASGEIPDIFPSKSTQHFTSYLDQELLSEVPKEVIQKYAPNLYTAIERDFSPAWNVCGLDGKNYGLPYLGGQYVFRDPIVWRDDWLENVGIDKIPDTIEEWEEALIKFRNNDPNKSGEKDTYGCSISIFAPVFGAHGVIVDGWFNSSWIEKDGKVTNSVIEPGAKEALKLLNRWYEMELLDPEFVTGENKGGYWAVSTDFVNGRIGVSAHGNPAHWQKTEKGLFSFANEKEMKKIKPNATYDFGNPPLGPDGKTRGTTQLPLCTGLSFVFSKDIEPDKLGKILEMFNWTFDSHENWVLNWMGTEGEHYTIKEQDGFKMYEYVEEYKDSSKRHQEAGTASLFFMMDVENTKKVTPAFFKYFEDLGFKDHGVIDLKTQLNLPSNSKYSTDLQKLATEAYVSIVTGAKPIEYFDEFVEEWKKSGGEQLLKEANDHYQKIK